MSLTTQTHQPGGFLRERVHSFPMTIASTAIDAGNSGQTHILRAGLVLAVLTTGGKLAEYDNTKSDGRETAKYVLMEEVDLKRGNPAASAADIKAEVLKLGTVYSGGLIGSDAAGIVELIAAGIQVLTV